MIARHWHGRVPAERADAYYQYLQRTGLRDDASTPGNRGLSVFRRLEGGVAHLDRLPIWDSWDAILLEREPTVTHYEVLETATR